MMRGTRWSRYGTGGEVCLRPTGADETACGDWIDADWFKRREPVNCPTCLAARRCLACKGDGCGECEDVGIVYSAASLGLLEPKGGTKNGQ